MRTWLSTSSLGLALALVSAGGTPASATTRDAQPLSPEEIRALMERARVHQHENDRALAEYERRERRYTWKHGAPPVVTEDKVFRVVPTGTGVLRLTVEAKGKPVTREQYQGELRELERALLLALRPTDPRQRQAIAKWEKRRRERRELVDALPQAFRFTWMGREERGGRSCVKLRLDPDPDFKPTTRNAEVFSHSRAVLWVDEAEAQLVRAEVEIIRDIGVFGGIFGKVYKGGKFVMEQVKVAEGVWLPARYEYDFDGRKFLFPFSLNEVTEVSRYRRIGPPQEALATVRREIQEGAALLPAKALPAGASQ